ncbi:hypothetical protein DFA_12135 [Cavenderia fasciculata]|uniref:Uncharacterized protein n=1 Tax=Cavenderia fasciculata TaxID=261658 RepID=F4QC82_CACFS|nr:uncharacterized protein DFA_12135 [Cavenderia fasciculata]EGG14363.1 hypothetical protein DFA_12135 [Cavenderia fasciculata]|eukprot:XP_004351087.1 hypothetical protein DFA_12135 [Cavenderia fasciculata]
MAQPAQLQEQNEISMLKRVLDRFTVNWRVKSKDLKPQTKTSMMYVLNIH